MDLLGTSPRIENGGRTNGCLLFPGSVLEEIFHCCCQRSQTIQVSGDEGALISRIGSVAADRCDPQTKVLIDC